VGLSKIYLTETEKFNDMRELTLREIQMASLNVLIEVDEICKELGLRYFLMYGTLIGAVRHKGFIPWDDDLDIGMPRKDFDQLVSFFDSKYSGALRMCTRANSEDYPHGIPRICDRRYKYVALEKTYKKEIQFVEKPEMGIFIDIYPIDNYGSELKKSELLWKRCRRKNFQFSVYNNFKLTRKAYYLPIKLIMFLVLYLNKGKNWRRTVDQEIKEIVNKMTSDEDRYVGVPTWSDIFVQYDQSWFDNQKFIEFEGLNFPVPESYKKVLEAVYGNYLTLPPENKRIPHHEYKIYKISDLDQGAMSYQ